ncbi:hypothetical protein ACTFIZ_006519 [Dictyostelium cf. discoideum]
MDIYNVDILFFKIWRNLFLRNQIINHLEIFRENKEVTIESKNDLQTNKNRDYFLKIIYQGSEMLYDNDLPECVEFLEVVNDFEIDNENKLPLISLKNPPSSLKTLKISSGSRMIMKPYPLNFFPDTITTLIFSGTDNRQFQPHTFKPSSNITSISFSFWYNFTFENNSLPRGIKELNFFKFSKFNQEFKLNQIPESLTTLKLPLIYSHPISKEFIQSLPLLETLFLPDTYDSLEYEFLKSIKNIKYFKPIYHFKHN